MTLKDIKQAVNLTLKESYPGTKIYGPDTIEGYTRPSFFCLCDTDVFRENEKCGP